MIIEPLKERLAYDIAIPLTKPRLTHNHLKLSSIDPLALDPIYEQEELAEPIRVTLKMEFAITESEVHQADLATGPPPIAEELLGTITTKVIQQANLPTSLPRYSLSSVLIFRTGALERLSTSMRRPPGHTCSASISRKASPNTSPGRSLS